MAACGCCGGGGCCCLGCCQRFSRDPLGTFELGFGLDAGLVLGSDLLAFRHEHHATKLTLCGRSSRVEVVLRRCKGVVSSFGLVSRCGRSDLLRLGLRLSRLRRELEVVSCYISSQPVPSLNRDADIRVTGNTHQRRQSLQTSRRSYHLHLP